MGEQTLAGFLAALADRSPVPGGGATAALHAAQAAALLEMAARFSAGRDAAHEDTLRRVITEAGRLRQAAADLIGIDGEAFSAVAGAYRLPRVTAGQRAARSAAIARAMVTASAPPAELVAAGAALLELAETLAPVVSRPVAGDLAAAVQAARAAVVTSRVNVEANLAAVTDPAARDRLAAAVAGAGGLEEQADRLTGQIRAGLSTPRPAAPTG